MTRVEARSDSFRSRRRLDRTIAAVMIPATATTPSAISTLRRFSRVGNGANVIENRCGHENS